MMMGVYYFLRNVLFNIDIVSVKECESELSNLSFVDCLKMLLEVEENFY